MSDEYGFCGADPMDDAKDERIQWEIEEERRQKEHDQRRVQKNGRDKQEPVECVTQSDPTPLPLPRDTRGQGRQCFICFRQS